MRRRRAWIVAGTAAFLALLPVATSPAQADDPAKPKTPPQAAISADDIAVAQLTTALDGAKSRLESVIKTKNLSGLAGFQYDAPGRRLIVWWQGAVPRDLLAVQRQLSGTAAVTFRPARYTFTVLQNEVQRLLSLSVAGKLPARIAEIGPRADGSGLEVGITPMVAGATSRIPSSIPLYVHESNIIPAFSRWDDFEPYFGGGGIHDFFDACSTAFATKKTGGTTLGMLFAAHCGPLGDAWETLATDRAYGTTTQLKTNRDTALITGKTYAGYVYSGAYGFTSSYVPVGGYSAPVQDRTVCVSGSFSGYKCNVKITGTNLTIDVGYLVYPIFRTQDMDDVGSVGNGDSGGPVFDNIYPNNVRKARGYGIISAIDTSAVHSRPCLGAQPDEFPGRQCSRLAYHANLNQALSDYGVTLLTA